MANTVPIHDFSNVTELNEEQKRQLSELERAQGVASDAGYRIVAPQPTAKLLSGYTIPLVGLGTWKSAKGEVGAAVATALRAGYRHIDCARIYQNEHEVGEALAAVLAEGVVKREEVFITSKLWNTDHDPARVEAACRKSMEDLRVSYLDLYLMHWPVTGTPGPEVQPPLADTWAAMEQRVDKGLVRTIGVSNFSAKKLEALMARARIQPAVNQVEAHPYWRNEELRSWCAARGVHLTAYSPLGSPDSAAVIGRAADVPSPLKDETVAAVAAELGKSPAQVLIRWAVQRGTSVLPKSVNPQRIAANLEVLVGGWQLAPEQVARLDALPVQRRMVDGSFWVDARGPYRSTAELWDE
eukprot:XP_001694768.1 low CO2-induced aldose reductase [Chlamydomonas reinhardtii]